MSRFGGWAIGRCDGKALLLLCATPPSHSPALSHPMMVLCSGWAIKQVRLQALLLLYAALVMGGVSLILRGTALYAAVLVSVRVCVRDVCA